MNLYLLNMRPGNYEGAVPQSVADGLLAATPAITEANPAASVGASPWVELPAVATPAALRAVTAHTTMDLRPVDSLAKSFLYYGTSMAVDDGANVLRPDNVLVSEPGRWIVWGDFQTHLIEDHVANVSNPHSVTAAQVGSYTIGAVDILLSGKSDTAHNHNGVYSLLAHGHTGTTDGSKLAQANTHEIADTDSSPTSLHHTLGTGENQACAGNDARLSDSRPANGGNSDTVDTKHAADFATAVHTHGGGDITSAVANATDSDTVDGQHAAAFAAASHTHPLSSVGFVRTAKGNANHNLTASDVLVDYTAARDAAYTVTLPDALLANAGQVWVIADGGRDAATHNIILDPEGATQIDGVDTITMDRNGGVIAVTPNNAGNAWEIILQA